jgi:EAL domain-containing protein (putative c-di-GMP-specific phosphodiesterase class I)
LPSPELQDLFRDNLLTIAFQPIVRLREGRVMAWEALGCVRYDDLSNGPVELFDWAGTLRPGVQAELSMLFRRKAVELVKDLSNPLSFSSPLIRSSLSGHSFCSRRSRSCTHSRRTST